MINNHIDQLLGEFIHSFFGYGNFDGEYWFVGMEEGGGNSLEEIKKRLLVWAKRGKRELEDVADYHIQLGLDYLFSERPKLQPTWSKLIRVYLVSKGESPTIEEVRSFQRDILGRLGGDTCLLELLPLPSPSTGEWLYDYFNDISYLKNRDAYKRVILRQRISSLKECIDKYKPKVVVFYSFGYREYWRRIASVEFEKQKVGFEVGTNLETSFVITKHPAAIGVTNDYFNAVGRFIYDSISPNYYP